MATVIKPSTGQSSPAGQTVRGVAFDLQDMSHRGEEYVESVRREAAKVVQQAHAEADQVRRRAEQAGREAAQQAIERLLKERVGEQIETLRPALAGVVSQLTEERGAWLDHWQRAAVELAVKIAERLVRRELERQPEIADAWVREALELAAGASEINVRLNPEDHARIGASTDAIAATLGELGAARLTADPTVSPGGCVVETSHGTVDMRLDSQLQRLLEDLS